jgi:hypothetical protein
MFGFVVRALVRLGSARNVEAPNEEPNMNTNGEARRKKCER